MGGIARTGAGLNSAQTLILTEPHQNAAGLVETLRRSSHRRLHGRAPLRVILVHGGEGPPRLPDLPDDAPLTIENFDFEAQAARALLARWPLHAGMDPPFGQTVHVLVAGDAPPAGALIVQAMRMVHYGDQQPAFTFASREPDAQRDALLAAYPQAEQFCRLRFKDIEDPELSKETPITGVYVCMDPPELGLETARRLAQLIADQQRASPLIHLEIGDAKPTSDIKDWDGQVLPSSYVREAFQPEVLLDGRGDELARVIHEHYRDSIGAQGRDPDAEPAGQPWQTLEASYRDASRQQADHLWAKLATVDCRAVPEELVESFAFAPLEVERLAIIEHKRWAADRYLDGWTYAPIRDNARKHHPQLIAYDSLSESMKDLDRFAVRLTPTLLARSGRGLVRMLLVGVPEATVTCSADNRLRRLTDRVMERLISRYPDRSLVLASTLGDAASRLVAQRAVERFEAGLFLLCPRPLSETLAIQRDERSRRDLLALIARAERRVTLVGTDELDRWFTQRAEIMMFLGNLSGDTRTGKRVEIDPSGGKLEWSFEY
ncbi:MAG: RyR domain-containing protein [Pseudomonadota bacterium]|nr:RyR domain-containing protein [Pseudomonadota bacterium]